MWRFGHDNPISLPDAIHVARHLILLVHDHAILARGGTAPLEENSEGQDIPAHISGPRHGIKEGHPHENLPDHMTSLRENVSNLWAACGQTASGLSVPAVLDPTHRWFSDLEAF